MQRRSGPQKLEYSGRPQRQHTVRLGSGDPLPAPRGRHAREQRLRVVALDGLEEVQEALARLLRPVALRRLHVPG